VPLLAFGFLTDVNDFPSDELLYLPFFHGGKGKNILRKNLYSGSVNIFFGSGSKSQLITGPAGCYLDIFVAIEKKMLTKKVANNNIIIKY
jgi:hypothetical protein